MIPRLGEKFELDVEVISKLRHEYQTTAYAQFGLPKAPAIMIGGKVIVAGRDISEQELETEIRQHLEETERKA